MECFVVGRRRKVKGWWYLRQERGMRSFFLSLLSMGQSGGEGEGCGVKIVLGGGVTWQLHFNCRVGAGEGEGVIIVLEDVGLVFLRVWCEGL